MRYTVKVDRVGVTYDGDDFYDAMQAYEDSIECYPSRCVAYFENGSLIRTFYRVEN